MWELFHGEGKGDRAVCAECRAKATIVMVGGRMPRKPGGSARNGQRPMSVSVAARGADAEEKG